MNAIERLLGIMKTLRDPQQGCPWDREQTHRSLRKDLLAETHEVLEAVDRALVAFVGPAADSSALQRAVDELTDTLLSHLSYEERELVEPIARLGVLV